MVHALDIQVPPQKVLGPSKFTPNTFSEGTWIPGDVICSYTHLWLLIKRKEQHELWLFAFVLPGRAELEPSRSKCVLCLGEEMASFEQLGNVGRLGSPKARFNALVSGHVDEIHTSYICC